MPSTSKIYGKVQCYFFRKVSYTFLTLSAKIQQNAMPRKVVRSTDKICQEDFPRAFFQSALRKSIKIITNAMLKQIVPSTDKMYL